MIHEGGLQYGIATTPGKHESWEASLFVKNLFDVRGNLGDEQSEISELPGRPRWMVATPRTVGIDVKKQF